MHYLKLYSSMVELRESVKKCDFENKMKITFKSSYGYGGKFGVERDRMDKVCVT